jgi:hypothetical protein
MEAAPIVIEEAAKAREAENVARALPLQKNPARSSW